MTHKPANTHLGWVMALTSTAYFMVVLDSVVVITALPRMQRDLHVSLASLQWTLNAYGIAFAAGIITAAALGDRFGRRKVFTVGLALFTFASIACALAPNLSALIVARTVQGLGGAVVLPLSLTILTAAFPIERRGMIVGVYGGLAGLAVAMGPIVGGAVTQSIDWHWIFWINVPIGVVAAILGVRLLPESYGAPERLDLVGVGLVTAGVVSLVWALSRASDVGWSSAEVVGTLIAGAALLGAFVVWESSVREPMVPLRLFAARDFAVGNVTTFLMSGAIFAGGAPGHGGVSARAPLLAGRRRPAPASVLRDADARLARGGRSVRPDRPAADHRRRAQHADRRVRLGRVARIAERELDRARGRAAGRRHRDLDGAPDGADRRPERRRRAGHGQGVGDQLHGAALRRGVRRRDRQHRVRDVRRPREPGRGDGRIQAGAVGVRGLRRPRRADRPGDVGTAQAGGRGRAPPVCRSPREPGRVSYPRLEGGVIQSGRANCAHSG